MMKNFAYILLFIVWMGGMSTSFLTVIIELIHWVAQKNEDQHSLPRRFWAAFAFFAITVLIALRSQILPWIEEITSGITIIPLILRSAAVLFILLLVLLFTLFLCKKVKHAFWGNTSGKYDNEQEKKEAVALLLTIGVILIYFLLPAVVGSALQDARFGSDIDAFLSNWHDGAVKLANFVQLNNIQSQNNKELNILISYTLFYVILLGICFAAIKIVYTILRNALIHESFTVWDQYSSAIGLLAVSIAILMGMQRAETGKPETSHSIIGAFISSFIVVLFVVAAVILALEAISLLIDMRRKLIKKEGKVIFVSLVGQITLIFLDVMKSLARAVESALGIRKSYSMDGFIEEQQDRVIAYMQEEMEEEIDNTTYQFPAFHVKVTRK